jgi:hypothetical protein
MDLKNNSGSGLYVQMVSDILRKHHLAFFSDLSFYAHA